MAGRDTVLCGCRHPHAPIGFREVAPGSASRPDRLLRSLAADYLNKASLSEVPTRLDLILVDFEQGKLSAQRTPGTRRPEPEMEYLRGAF